MNPLIPLTTVQRSIGIAQNTLNKVLRYVPVITISLSLPFIPSSSKAGSVTSSFRADSDDVVTYEVIPFDDPNSLSSYPDSLSFQPYTPMLDTLWVTAPRLEERVNVPKSATRDSLKARYQPKAVEAAKKADIDPILYSLIVETESSWDPRAFSNKEVRRGETVYTQSLGVGLSQLSPMAAEEVAKDIGVERHKAYEVIRRDPIKNLEAGAFYFKRMFIRYNGNVPLALAAYNAGPGKVLKYGGIPPYKETIGFVTSILNKYKPRSA